MSFFLDRIGKLFEILWVDDLAFMHRRQHDPFRGAGDGDRFGRRLFLDVLKYRVTGFPESGFQFTAAVAVFVGFERPGNGHPHQFNELLHIPAKRCPPAGRQLNPHGPVGLGEIIEVAGVGRRRHTGGAAFQELADNTVLAGARRPQGEHVVALLSDADAETNRLYGAVLADDPIAILELLRRLEAELGGIAKAAELIDRKRCRHALARVSRCLRLAGRFRHRLGLPFDTVHFLIAEAEMVTAFMYQNIAYDPP